MIEVLGVLGFTISVGLAALRVWEVFFRRAKYRIYFVWDLGDESENAGPWLTFTIANIGHAVAAIQALVFRKSGTDGAWSVAALTDHLPLLLEVGHVSAPFRIEARYGNAVLLTGKYELELMDVRGNRASFDIPKLDLDDVRSQGTEDT